MLPCGSSSLDYLEANKENFPLSKLDRHSLVLPLESRSEEVDVVTVEEGNVPLTPCLSQASSTMSPGSITPIGGGDDLDGDSDDGETTSRKEKSLGLLCQRFLVAMSEETRLSATSEVHLESVAKKMNVEKRRIYDIVNVMEALDAMSKTNKSFYRWNGLQDLPRLMFELQQEAADERLPERVLRVEQAMCSFTELSGKRAFDTVGSVEDKTVIEMPPSQLKSRIETRDRQGRNSLAQLCRRFLMVLLSNPKTTRRVSLDVASTVLIKDPETEGFEPPSRSRCRRLYDIANVLVALGLIKKVHYLFGTKKIPLFVYCGPEPDEFGKYDMKMVVTSSSAPQTPLMKTATATVQSLNLGKRSHSVANLPSSSEDLQKLPRMKSENIFPTSSLMMFAELAAERLRLESLAADVGRIPKPQAQHTAFLSPLRQPFSPLGLTNFVLPQAKSMWTPLRASPLLTSPTSRPLPPAAVKSSPKHSVSHILGNRTNLDHKQSSAFQPVKKTPFAALHNLSSQQRL